jgi:2-keto-3-deoxy-L-rhamnonate aldolase RhmA
LGHAGFEWLVVETEHNALDAAETQQMLMAIDSTPALPFVRLPSRDPVGVQRALDMGAMGVMTPMIRTADDAAAVVRATRYPPSGARGYGPLRAARYGQDAADYFYRANDHILTMFIIETREAVDNLDAIAAVPGVDVLYFGPFDLCLSIGLDPLKQPHPEIEAIYERALPIGKRHGVAIGTGSANPDQLAQRARQGFTCLGYASDYALLGAGAKTGIEAFSAFGS